MVYFKRLVLASVFTLGSLISAEVDTLSLKQIILAIPDDGVRGSIESAYVARDYDEVERGLINYLEEYAYEDSGVKEKAMGIIYERVQETRAFNDPAFQDVEDPDSAEDEDMDELTAFEKMIKRIESMELPELVEQHMEEGEAKTKLLEDIESGDTTMTSADLDNYIDYSVQKWYPDMPKEHVEILKTLLHAKTNDYFGTKEFEEGADEDEDEGSPDNFDGYLQWLQSMDLNEIVDMLPDFYEKKAKIQEEMAEGEMDITEYDINEFVDSLPGLSEEFKEDAKAIIHEKFMAYGTTVAAPELMEGESGIVDALRDIAETQQKITELINDLEGGI